MSKLILLSVLLAMVLIPSLAARDLDARRGFKRAVQRTAAFFAVYALALRYFWTP